MSMTTHSQPEHNRGFTLVELVVILVVLAIFAAVAVPVFFNLERYRERAAYDEVASALRYGQKLALASGCEVQVKITGAGYALQQRQTSCTSGTFVTVSGHPVTSGSLSGIGISPVSDIIFDPMGRGSGITLSVGGKNITVIAETGYVDAP
jgi:MSHA pilin protein MshC